ncbi:acyl-CoA dehydrogenase domain protein [Mycobacterium kansasii 732]|nr:acyl-CoA dehydrogenase domain protein [Mycobacterium kansasii 732]
MNVEQFRAGLRAWLDEHDLTPGPDHSLRGQMRQLARVHHALYAADWMRYGWPVEVGGLGGPRCCARSSARKWSAAVWPNRVRIRWSRCSRPR